MADKSQVAPDYEGLNKELAAELLDLRGRLLASTKQAQQSAEMANSLSAKLDEANAYKMTCESAQRQAEGNLKVLQDSIPPKDARIAKLEADLRTVVDSFKPVHDKALALRPE
jgi:chromosome segregation ATPase